MIDKKELEKIAELMERIEKSASFIIDDQTEKIIVKSFETAKLFIKENLDIINNGLPIMGDKIAFIVALESQMKQEDDIYEIVKKEYEKIYAKKYTT